MRNLRKILRCRIRPISKFLPAVVSCLCVVAVSLAANNDFRLIQAVKTKDTASIRGLLKAGIDVNTPQGGWCNGASLGRRRQQSCRRRFVASLRRTRERRERSWCDAA